MFSAAPRGDQLEEEFKGKLNYAGIFASSKDLTESGIAEVAVGIGELRVIPRVVKLGAEFRRPALPQLRVFHERDIRVAQRRTAAKRVRHVAERAWSGIVDVIGREPEIAVRLRIYELNFPGHLRGVGVLEEEATLELQIILRLDADWKAALITDDGGRRPAVQQL